METAAIIERIKRFLPPWLLWVVGILAVLALFEKYCKAVTWVWGMVQGCGRYFAKWVRLQSRVEGAERQLRALLGRIDRLEGASTSVSTYTAPPPKPTPTFKTTVERFPDQKVYYILRYSEDIFRNDLLNDKDVIVDDEPKCLDHDVSMSRNRNRNPYDPVAYTCDACGQSITHHQHRQLLAVSKSNLLKRLNATSSSA